ncbi:MAG TPA: hypothetical protein VNE40_01615 [Candidatus Dormibacteraeota bacterium]|nr:hypothetical protein [Candidatus Dormibacteraeota bacterium]
MSEPKNEQLSWRVVPPEALGEDEWRAVQGLMRDAFTADLAFKVGLRGVNRLTNWAEPDYFRESRLNPQVAVQKGDLHPGNFQNLLVTLAYEGNEPVGYLYSADNTSGHKPSTRWLKMHTPPSLPLPKIGSRKYAWQREIAVHPDLRQQGIAHVLGYLSLAERHPKQPVTAYVWPRLLPHIFGSLREQFAFRDTTLETVYPFDSKKGTQQLRLVGVAGKIIERIIEPPETKSAVESAKAGLKRQ